MSTYLDDDDKRVELATKMARCIEDEFRSHHPNFTLNSEILQIGMLKALDAGLGPTTLHVEKQIIDRIITDAFARKWVITINDGEETTLKYSSDREKIIEAMMSTDEDYLILHDKPHGNQLGWVRLIYSNGRDVISDHNTKLEEFIKPIFEWIEQTFE